jgi:hypothetical protein
MFSWCKQCIETKDCSLLHINSFIIGHRLVLILIFMCHFLHFSKKNLFLSTALHFPSFLMGSVLVIPEIKKNKRKALFREVNLIL